MKIRRTLICNITTELRYKADNNINDKLLKYIYIYKIRDFLKD